MKRFFGIVCLVFGVILIAACSDNGEQDLKEEVIRPVKFMTIDLLSTKQHDFPGEVNASKQALLAFRVPGEILKYHVYSGQQVKQGQLLAELDPVEYQLLVNARQANYDLAQVKERRARVLVKDYLISQEDFDRDKTALQVADSALKTAQANLSYAQLYAPYDGIIAATYRKDYEYVNAQQPVLSFQSANAIDIEIAVPERLITALAKTRAERGNTSSADMAQVSFPVNSQKTYSASFKNIGTVADGDTGSYKVKLTMAQPDAITLYPGMAAMVSVRLKLSEQELNSTIPASAIIEEGGQVYVWRIKSSQTLEKAYVEVTANNTLAKGLNDGDIIVTAGAKELKEGQRVKKWLKERGL